MGAEGKGQSAKGCGKGKGGVGKRGHVAVFACQACCGEERWGW